MVAHRSATGLPNMSAGHEGQIQGGGGKGKGSLGQEKARIPRNQNDKVPQSSITAPQDITATQNLDRSASLAIAPCPQCCTPSNCFYCAICLSERIISHHLNVKRVDDMRLKERSAVEGLLHTDESSMASSHNASPFGLRAKDESEVMQSGIDSHRRLKAKEASLRRLIESSDMRSKILRARSEEASRVGEQRRLTLQRRQAMLQKASSICLDNIVASRDQSIDVFSISGLRLLREDVKRIKKEAERTAYKLAEARAVLARETFSLFRILPPSGTMAGARAARGEGAGNVTGNSSRSGKRPSERQVPGAFLFDTKLREQDAQNAFLRRAKPPKTVSDVNANDWTIMNLVLPLPSDIKRFDRSRVNGAIAHTVHLLQLLTVYLGTALPFVITGPAEMPSIRPNALWGSGARQSLYLSSATYNALVASEGKTSAEGVNNLRASMISTLGASTMSTLESFVHLPGGSNALWANRTAATHAPPGAVEPRQFRSSEGERTKTDSSGETASSATRQFYTALTMLTYSIAYVAHLQGLNVDLPNAAGSPLRLLYKMITSPRLGERAHTTSCASYHVVDLTFNQLDFAQLAQVYEPRSLRSAVTSNDGRTSGTGRKAIRAPAEGHAKAVAGAQTSNTIDMPMLDGSYIDARKAAESILVDANRRQGVGGTRATMQGTAAAATQRAKQLESASLSRIDAAKAQRSSLAAKRVAAPAPLQSVKEQLSSPASNLSQNKSSKLNFLHLDADAAASGRQAKSSSASKRALQGGATEEHRIDVTTSNDRRTAGRDGTVQKTDERQSESSAAASSNVNKARSGTVMFNGKEIKGKAREDFAAAKGGIDDPSTTTNLRTSTLSKSKMHRKADEDDDGGWAVL